MQYVARTTNNIGYVVNVAPVIFPPLRGLAVGLHSAADAADRGSKALRNTVIPPMSRALEAAKRTMQGAHTVIRLGRGVLMKLSAKLANFDRWETQDTLEFHARWPGLCGTIFKYPCWKDDYLPTGWGRDNADLRGSLVDVWPPRRTAQSAARSDGGRHHGWSGVPTRYDIADKSIANRATPGLDFLAAVGRPEGHDVPTTSLGVNRTIGSVAGPSETPARLASARNTAFTKARGTLERPKKGLLKDLPAENLRRDDAAKAYGFLCSPCWQARLADLTVGEKTAILAAIGQTPDHLFYPPGAQTKK